ncbi:DUF5954 family protein [Plantactinospora sp. KLBMP9567]|uniref:DUF5954 family protein n=1 Tax=Plantactinospora sp. KLBMP9567 TaxID=3085900 RepID=UPI0029813810|nr:DUF5954 family protein [Plantactinospora sp. KLBMP9567]MDW5324811.1 DUF5954 family protein [Plantactinospora sp. KLBMP9567]MDW5330578.1 DUF5954 family protein [Plantactinospora sp. KLBMP9567]
MTHHGRQVPDHLLIRIAQRNDPVSAVSEDDARRRSLAYPKLMWGAPVFGYAEEVAGRWRILSLSGDQPQGSRDALGSYFRRLLSETPETSGHAAERREYQEAIRLLDWEVVDDLTVYGRRYRIIRAQPFIRMGPDGPEPPRPTDPDPYPPGKTRDVRCQEEGFVIDPAASTGLADGLLRIEMVPAYYKAGIVPDDVRADSRRALATHPNVVLLPVGFTIGEYVHGSWQPRSFATYPTPQAARDSAAFRFSDIVPHEDASLEEIRAAYTRAMEEFEAPRTDEFEIRGVRCRVTRVERFVRVGPDGPEGPRPSDWDPEPPPELHCQQLREQGLLPDPE